MSDTMNDSPAARESAHDPLPASASDPAAIARRTQRQRERRQRSRLTVLRLVLIGVGVIAGLVAGLLYTWKLNPVVQTNVAPWQLDPANQTEWVIAVSLSWANTHDLVQAADRLNALHWGDQTFQRVADTACNLIQSSYAQSEAGLIAIRSMAALAQGQGKTGCASTWLNGLDSTAPAISPTAIAVSPTATLVPPPSKTPIPTDGPSATANAPIIASATPAIGDFKAVRTEPYCSAATPGLLEVFVQELGGKGIPGMAVRASAPGGTDRFFTGLELDHDPGYADFHMQSGQTYTLTVEGSTISSGALIAAPCTVQGGGTSVTSYRVYFRRAAPTR